MTVQAEKGPSVVVHENTVPVETQSHAFLNYEV